MRFSLLVFTVLLPTFLFADAYHHKNVLVGERAQGLGGAYVAIADDPSGIYHNPAGIVFGLENYLSVSANAFSSGEQTFKDIYPGQDYKYSTSDFVPVLFGFTQNLGKNKFGFAVIVPDSERIDQSDTVTRIADSTAPARRFTRKFLSQDTTYMAGPAYAMELNKNLSIGASVFGLARTSKLINNLVVLFDPIGNGKYYVETSNLNIMSYALVSKVGVQYMPTSNVSVGLVFSMLSNLGGNGSSRTIRTRVDPATNEPVTPTGNFTNDMEQISSSKIFNQLPTNMGVSAGAAYFPSKAFLVTGQVDYYFAQKSYREFPIQQVVNVSGGAEYYVLDWLAVRGGAYTNNAKTFSIDTKKTTQPPHVNLFGVTAGISSYRSGTSITLGLSYSLGTGLGQAFADTTLTQTVKQSSSALYISGSYQL